MKKHFYKFLEKNPTVQQKLLGEGNSMLDIYKIYKAHVKKVGAIDLYFSGYTSTVTSIGLIGVFTAVSLPPAMAIGGAIVSGFGLFYGINKLLGKSSREIAESRMDFEVRYMRPNRRLVVN